MTDVFTPEKRSAVMRRVKSRDTTPERLVRKLLTELGVRYRLHRADLPGKPAPDTFLAAASDLGVRPDECVVFEDALAGVAAGRAGDFGYVVGVDRVDQADGLREQGADVVVADLEELL